MSRKTRKLIWSAPLVAVLAVAGALALFVALEPGSVFANPLPAAPSELEVEAASGDAGRTALVLDWDAPAGGNVSGYRIDKVDGSGHIWETMVMDTGNANTSYTDGGLTASDTRWYRVFAVNDHGVGPVSNRASGTTDNKINPGSVRNLRAVPNTKNPRTRLDLSWDAPTEDGGEMIAGYEIQVHAGGEWIAVSQIGEETPTPEYVTRVTKTSYMDTHAKDPGDKQLYRVRAVNGTEELDTDDVNVMASADEDASKAWVQVTGTTQAAAAPGQVTGLTAVNLADGASINLYWYDPEDTGGWKISGYVIQAYRQGKKFPSAPSVATIKAATFVAAGPTLDADSMDNATWYQDKSAVGSVRQARFIDIGGLDHDEDDATEDVQQRWSFRVYAVTTDRGPDNDEDEAEDNVIRRSRSPSSTASETPGTRLTLDHDKDEADDTVTNKTPRLDPLAAPAIVASTDDGNTPDVQKQQIDLRLTVSDTLTDAVPVVYQDGFRIDYSTNLGLSWKVLEPDTSFTELGGMRLYEDNDDLGFDEGRTYRVFAIGRHSYTDVGPADLTIITGMTADSTVPDKPTGAMASSPSLRSIEASWTAPKDNGGQPITKYLVQWITDDDDDVAEAEDFDTTDRTDSATIGNDSTDDAMTMGTFQLDADLEDDTVYVFRVAAVSQDADGNDQPVSATATADGEGEGAPKWSDPVLFNTTEALMPTAVEGLTSEAATDSSGDVTGVNLLWNKPSNDIPITNYDIEVQDAEGDWANPDLGEDSPARRTSYTDPDEPEADEVRKYRVRASNTADDGPWTMVYYPREPAAHSHTAVDPDITSVTVSGSSVTIMWTDGVPADSHSVGLVSTTDYSVVAEEDMPTGNMATFDDVPDGTYFAIVAAFEGFEYEFDLQTVTVPGS